MSDNANVKITTPPGIAVWPRLNEPDTKFDPEGKYSVKLRLSEEDGRELADKIEAMALAHLKTLQEEEKNPAKRKKIKLADMPFTVELDEETGDETGHLLFNFKMTASGTSKRTGKEWTRRPALYDAKGNKVPASVEIGSGSRIRVAGELSPFYVPSIGVGVALRLEAVRILELRAFGQRSAADYGFGDEDEGDFDVSGMDASDDKADSQEEDDFDDPTEF